MASYGYGYVTEKGFIAFAKDLAEGAWKDVVIGKKYEAPSHVLPVATLLDAPRVLLWKLRISWAIADLTEAMGLAGGEALLKVDANWDRLQRKLNHSLAAAAEDNQAEHADAAGRLQKSLLLGNGTAQTQLGYDEEVDFGWQQAELIAKGQAAADVKLLGLGALMTEIAAVRSRVCPLKMALSTCALTR